jgi:hypothetical protein
VAALVADIWTIFYVALMIGWQTSVFLKKGSWPTLPLSSIFNEFAINRAAIYVTTSTGEMRQDQLVKMMGAALQIPAILPLVLAAGLLTAFYLWLTHVEKQHLGK